MTSGAARSATAASMRDSRLPRGMWIAPGMNPCSYSSRSRTSTKTGAADASRK